MLKLRTLAMAGLATLAIALMATGDMAHAKNNNGQGGKSSGSDPSGGRVWSHKEPADGVILCATRSCMKSSPAAAVTHVPNNPNGRPYRRPIVENETCSTTRYVYPNGTVIVQSSCPRAVMGVISTHR
ncbi:hypothetical protein [Stappia sp. TSB10GB4]|uniref:hypothetical protein n=1 Tax=Stappia sp. TSB10GB4 TaxID=2003584 RepID=UPI0016460567|nr:hypothetical protein [Stappia sp. TSB10GB4]